MSSARRRRCSNDRRAHKGDPGNPEVSQAGGNGKECQRRSGGYHGTPGQRDSAGGRHRGRRALLLPLRHPLRRGGPHHRDRGHCRGVQLQLPRLHHLHLGPGPSVPGTFPVVVQRSVLEGEAEEQKSQEAGEPDNSGGESAGLVCLGANETSEDAGPEGRLRQPGRPGPRWEDALGRDQRRGVASRRRARGSRLGAMTSFFSYDKLNSKGYSKTENQCFLCIKYFRSHGRFVALDLLLENRPEKMSSGTPVTCLQRR